MYDLFMLSNVSELFEKQNRLLYDYNLTNRKIHKFNFANLWG